MAWKEPVFFPGNAPLLTADSQVAVKIDDNFIWLTADIALEDLRGQTKEWQLLLPLNAKVEVKTAPGVSFELLYPDAKQPRHVIRLTEPSAERLAVNVQVRHPRPFLGSRLPVGPFFVFGTYRQEGTITVSAAPDALRGKRLAYHRTGDIYPRDIPRAADALALYKFWNIPGESPANKGLVPLELEFIIDNKLAEATLDHSLNIKPAKQGWLIEMATTIHLKNRPDFLDIQLPRIPGPRLDVLGVSVGTPFPTALPWFPLAPPWGNNIPQAVPLNFTCEDENCTLTPPNKQRKVRLTWNRSPGNEIKIIGRYLVPAGVTCLNIELPRPLDVVDRGGKVKIKVPDQHEVSFGASGNDGLTPEKSEVQASWDAFPQSLDIAWKPNLPEFSVTGLTDIWLHDRSTEVKHRLSFTVPKGTSQASSGESAPLRFKVPGAIRDLAIVSGGKLVAHDAARETALIVPYAEPSGARGGDSIALRFSSLPKKEDQGPKNSQRAVGRSLDLAGENDQGNRQGSSLERDWFRALFGQGGCLERFRHGNRAGQRCSPLVGLTWGRAQSSSGVAAGRCHLSGVGVHGLRSGSYSSRHRRRGDVHLSGSPLDSKAERPATWILSLLMPAGNCLQNVWLDNQKIANWDPLESGPYVASVPVYPKLYQQPVVLEIEYKLPPNYSEIKRFWRTTLAAPQFRGAADLGRIRWQVGFPFSWVGMVPERDAEYQWGLQGWLLGPEPAVTSADLESWLTGRDAKDSPAPVSLIFAQAGSENVKLLHLSRQLWLLLCSGALLALGLTLNVLPLSRSAFWLVMIGLGIAVLSIGLLWPEWVPLLVYGCQPGAAVLVVLLGIQWMLRESYRRSLVFMPGFTRLKANSSLIRPRRAAACGGSPRPLTRRPPALVPRHQAVPARTRETEHALATGTHDRFHASPGNWVRRPGIVGSCLAYCVSLPRVRILPSTIPRRCSGSPSPVPAAGGNGTSSPGNLGANASQGLRGVGPAGGPRRGCFPGNGSRDEGEVCRRTGR